MRSLILVGSGGLLGAVLRYKLGGWILHHSESWRFPIGTFAVNALGCLAIGLLTGALERREVLEPRLALFLITGMLGSFTTFSAFGYETLSLFRRGDFVMALVNVLASVSVCLAAVWSGSRMGHGAAGLLE